MRAIVDDHTEPPRNGDDGPCMRYIDSRFFTSFGFGMPDPGGLPRACHDLRETGGGQRGRNKGGRAPGAEARSASWRPPPAASRPMPRRGPRRPAPAGPSSPRRRAPRPAFPARGRRTCQNPSTCNAQNWTLSSMRPAISPMPCPSFLTHERSLYSSSRVAPTSNSCWTVAMRGGAKPPIKRRRPRAGCLRTFVLSGARGRAVPVGIGHGVG